jgi:hypothetical protein
LVARESAIRKQPLGPQLVCSTPGPKARQYVDGEEEIHNSEEEIDAQKGGNDEEQ